MAVPPIVTSHRTFSTRSNALTSSCSVFAKALKVRSTELRQAEGKYDSSHPWFRTLAYELRNFYDIRGRDISIETLTLRVRRIDAGESTNPDRDKDGTQYIEILSLDQRGNPGSANPNEPDGAIDDQYIYSLHDGGLWKTSLDGQTRVLMAADSNYERLVIDDSNVYLTAGAGQAIIKVPKLRTAVTLAATANR